MKLYFICTLKCVPNSKVDYKNGTEGVTDIPKFWWYNDQTVAGNYLKFKNMLISYN